jgi:methylenetetrahydrofolate dehydrogenase (NADP+)/methenyltetrahydrofolate cyclohydrolase
MTGNAQIIDGRACARALKETVVVDLKHLRDDSVGCGLATVMVGDDYSAAAYERRLRRVADELDVPYFGHRLAGDVVEDDVLTLVRHLNSDSRVTAILVLRPLPAQVREAVLFQALSPLKDIEAVHPENAGLLALGIPRYVPSTAASVYHLLDTWLDEVGEHRGDFYHRSLVVVVGRSNNVGKPAVSLAFDRQTAVESVDVWASRTRGLGRHTRRADVLVVAAGQAGLIKAEHVKEGAVVIDVGINPVIDPETDEVHMVGDVDLAGVSTRARAITPVPGGVGPVTDLWLMRNTVYAARAVHATR